MKEIGGGEVEVSYKSTVLHMRNKKSEFLSKVQIIGVGPRRIEEELVAIFDKISVLKGCNI